MRKKWTPKSEVNDALLLFREKRKWQIALRRYIVEEKGGSTYAPYYGLDRKSFRNWIEIQFDEDTDWDNFSKKWQFDHIVPVAYFDFAVESDLRLCWNFTNIRIEKLILNKARGNRIDVISAKPYFEELYARTNYAICRDMIAKIEQIEVSQIKSSERLEQFILENTEHLKILSSFSEYEFGRFNEGASIEEIVEERNFSARF